MHRHAARLATIREFVDGRRSAAVVGSLVVPELPSFVRERGNAPSLAPPPLPGGLAVPELPAFATPTRRPAATAPRPAAQPATVPAIPRGAPRHRVIDLSAAGRQSLRQAAGAIVDAMTRLEMSIPTAAWEMRAAVGVPAIQLRNLIENVPFGTGGDDRVFAVPSLGPMDGQTNEGMRRSLQEIGAALYRLQAQTPSDTVLHHELRLLANTMNAQAMKLVWLPYAFGAWTGRG